MILATLALCLALQEKPAELARLFLDGTDAESAQARAKLLAVGTRAIPELSRLRGAKKRAEALEDLLFDLKAAAAGEAGRAVFAKLRTTRMTVDMQQAPPVAILDYFREITGLNLVPDPGLAGESPAVTLLVSDVPFRKALETLCAAAGLDYDFRLGVLLVAPPDRLWDAPKEVRTTPLTGEETRKARAWIVELGSDSPKARDQAAAEFRRLGSAAIPILEEAARGTDAEIVGRARSLVAELAPRPDRWSRLPGAAAWRSQKLEGADLAVAKKLDALRIHLAFEASKPADILSFLRDFSELRIETKGPLPDREISIKVKDLPLGACLELLALPLGLDVRIEKGTVQIVARK